MKPISERLIISLYDYSENWVKPYIEAGYPVICWDKAKEGCILEGFTTLMLLIEESGLDVYGILAAPPCTEYASSGARWWAAKSPELLEEAMCLTQIVLLLVDLYQPYFWVLENPRGRIEKCNPELKPYRLLVFDPCEYGDPYTKETFLWGEFNPLLPVNPVLPLYGSKMHKMPAGRRRSNTPVGFARAFFKANQ